MTWKSEDIVETAIVKVEGHPNALDQPREESRWKAFKYWVCPFLRKKKELGEAYLEAKVLKEESEAEKTIQEAAEIAAKKDFKNLESSKLFNEIIDGIFSNDKLPVEIKVIKLANLMQNNPQTRSQLDRVQDIIRELNLTRGLSIEEVDDPDNETLHVNKSRRKILATEVSKDVQGKGEIIEEELAAKLALPIEKLDLTIRSGNCLYSNRIETVGQLAVMTEAELLKIRSFGKTGLREIRRKLADMGLSLGMTGLE